MRSVLRYRITVSDDATDFKIAAGRDVLRAEAVPVDLAPNGYARYVDFWVEHRDDDTSAVRTFRVFGTGHPVPLGAVWQGTTQRTEEGLVWHLYELLTEAAR